ncbi:glycerol transporter [Dispira simplex]|nr:glycerol transporter [Dispira simplex]
MSPLGATKASFGMKSPKPSLWRTKEFYFYYLCFMVGLPMMCYTAYTLSSDQLPNYQHYKQELSEGWLFGRQIDNSDTQYRGFRDNLPLLTLGIATFVLINRGSQYLLRRTVGQSGTISPALYPVSPLTATSVWSRVTWHFGHTWVLPRLYLTMILSLVFLYVVFGNSTLIILLLTMGNYILARILGGWKVGAPIVFWVYNLGMLFFNETYHGYHFAHMAPWLAPLDHNRGIMTRWDVFFNITMLRMVSFSMDYHWARLESTGQLARTQRSSGQGTSGNEPRSAPEHDGAESNLHDHPAPLTEKQRSVQSCSLSDYNLVHYFAYLFYIPLYFAGPVITFNNFIWQQRRPSPDVSCRTTVVYGLRLLGALFLMESMQHLLYVVAISHTKAWEGFSPFQMSMVGYFNLKFIWLKLMIIWRYFRFWALCDGMDVPENMRRCMSNNYSVQSFWRDWHVSFNRWLVRYLYIPLGGRRFIIYNIWAVFTFVAVWHDISLRLLAWAWLICLAIVPELLLSFIFNRPKYSEKSYFRFFCGVGCVLNIFMLMVANLVGFSVGVEGVQSMLEQIFCLKGLAFVLITFACVFIAVQIMFEIREHEYRQKYQAAQEQWQVAHPNRSPIPEDSFELRSPSPKTIESIPLQQTRE